MSNSSIFEPLMMKSGPLALTRGPSRCAPGHTAPWQPFIHHETGWNPHLDHHLAALHTLAALSPPQASTSRVLEATFAPLPCPPPPPPLPLCADPGLRAQGRVAGVAQHGGDAAADERLTPGRAVLGRRGREPAEQRLYYRVEV